MSPRLHGKGSMQLCLRTGPPSPWSSMFGGRALYLSLMIGPESIFLEFNWFLNVKVISAFTVKHAT